jgi:hypothetical protein
MLPPYKNVVRDPDKWNIRHCSHMLLNFDKLTAGKHVRKMIR